MNISMIGFGNIAQAMAKGLIHNRDIQLRVASPSLPKGINPDGIETYSNNLEILPHADIIILAVKPTQMALVLQEIASDIPPNCLVISVASGLNLTWYALNRPLIRAMPNIAAAIGQSATPLIANEWVTDKHAALAEQLFSNMGITTWLTDETHMDALTALSGSGPAYVFLFIESMIKAAISLNLPRDVATTFTLQTMQGALSLVNTQNKSPAELRAEVTSPAGTTAAAIQVFMDHGFEKIIQNAMQAACDRSIYLGKLHSSK